MSGGEELFEHVLVVMAGGEESGKIMDTKLVKFKNSFTEEQREAIWQYVIDHTKKPDDTGFFVSRLCFRDQDDMWKRIHARYIGDFSRYNKLERQEQANKTALSLMKKNADFFSKVTEQITNNGTFAQKLVLWIYRKTRNYLKCVKIKI